MAFASDQVAARRSWGTPYAFEPYNGGDGVAIVVTTTAQQVALAMPSDDNATVLVIANTGAAFAYVKTGPDSTIRAHAPPNSGTGSCSMAVPPGGAVTVQINVPGEPTNFWLSAICGGSDTTTVQATVGFGGV